jgi:hypothetical protein
MPTPGHTIAVNPVSPAVSRGAVRFARWLLPVSLLMLAAVAPVAHAQLTVYSDLRVVPDPAPAGTAVVARVRREGCLSSGTLVVTRQGSTVNLTPAGGPIICGVAPPPTDVDFALGAFAPGRYTVVFDASPPLIAGFSVVASTAVPVVSDPEVIAGLAVATLLLGAACVRRR